MANVGGLIFGADQPVSDDASDNTTYCIGTRFRSDVAGSIPQVHWRMPNNYPGTLNHDVIPIKAQLWRVATSTVIATAQFDDLFLGEWNHYAVTGWNINADEDYIFSVVTDRYTASPGYFPVNYTNGHITAIAQAGRFHDYNQSVGLVTPIMPTDQYNSGGYFLDIDFIPESSGQLVSVWNGSAELPVGNISVWNGTSEVPAIIDSVV